MKKKKGLGKLLAGVALGTGLGVLFAPKKGSETRAQLKEKLDEMIARLKDVDAEDIKETIETKIYEIKEELADLDKEKVLKAKDIETEVTGTSTSHPVRVLRNKLTREYIKIEKSNSNSEKLESLTRGALRKAVIEGDTENGSVMAGQIAGLVKKEQSCKEIIEELMTEFDKCINYK